MEIAVAGFDLTRHGRREYVTYVSVHPWGSLVHKHVHSSDAGPQTCVASDW